MTRAIESLRLSQLLPAIKDKFGEVPDIRYPDAGAHFYPLPDVLMSGLAMMFAHDPSMYPTIIIPIKRPSNLRSDG